MFGFLLLSFAILTVSYLVYDAWVQEGIEVLKDRLLDDPADEVYTPNRSNLAEGVPHFERTANEQVPAVFEAIKIKLKKAGWPYRVMPLIIFVLAMTLFITLIAYIFSGYPTLSLLLLFLLPLLILLFLRIIYQRRVYKLNDQLSALTSQFITTVRSGGTPMQALMSTAENGPSPLRESISELLLQMQLGVPPIEAWRRWAQFWDTEQTKMVSFGMRLKWDAGGEMSGMLTHILDNLEFRRRMEIRVKTLTSQAKLSVYVLTALPFLIGLLIYLVRPELYQDTISDPFGQKMLIAVGVAMFLGFLWLRRIARIEY